MSWEIQMSFGRCVSFSAWPVLEFPDIKFPEDLWVFNKAHVEYFVPPRTLSVWFKSDQLFRVSLVASVV